MFRQDITMCSTKKCFQSKKCLRSPDSGTQPQKDGQSWSDFYPLMVERTCDYFIEDKTSARR